MTHSGGKPHQVGDEGQRYELTVQSDEDNKRIVICWSDSKKFMDNYALSVVTRLGWSDAEIQDRHCTEEQNE